MRRAVAVLLVALTPIALVLGLSRIRIPVISPELEPSDLSYQIDSISLQNGTFSMDGYLLKRGDSQWYAQSNKHVWLQSKDGVYYQLQTIEYIRGDAPDEADGMSYRYCGFRVNTDISDLLDKSTTYNIILVYQKQGMLYSCDTGLTIAGGQLIDS